RLWSEPGSHLGAGEDDHQDEKRERSEAREDRAAWSKRPRPAGIDDPKERDEGQSAGRDSREEEPAGNQGGEGSRRLPPVEAADECSQTDSDSQESRPGPRAPDSRPHPSEPAGHGDSPGVGASVPIHPSRCNARTKATRSQRSPEVVPSRIVGIARPPAVSVP